MVLGDPFIEELQTTQGLVKVRSLAVEPVADIAVLGALDEYDAFEAWCAHTSPVPLCVQDFPLLEPFPVYIFTHTEQWIQARATLIRTDLPSIWAKVPEQIEGGTSGSPIVTERGELSGIVSNTGSGPHQAHCDVMAPRPHLTLPGWVIRRILAEQTP